MSQKTELRKKFKETRAAVGGSERMRSEPRICRRVLQLAEPGSSVFVYSSFGSEVSTRKIISELIKKECRVCLPRMTGKAAMEAVFWDGDDKSLVKNGIGILEPSGNEICGNAGLAIVPGLAFDLEGRRLGYGAGCYDRWFAENECTLKAGICFEKQLADFLPESDLDVKMDYIVTECRTKKIE